MNGMENEVEDGSAWERRWSGSRCLKYVKFVRFRMLPDS